MAPGPPPWHLCPWCHFWNVVMLGGMVDFKNEVFFGESVLVSWESRRSAENQGRFKEREEFHMREISIAELDDGGAMWSGVWVASGSWVWPLLTAGRKWLQSCDCKDMRLASNLPELGSHSFLKLQKGRQPSRDLDFSLVRCSTESPTAGPRLLTYRITSY